MGVLLLVRHGQASFGAADYDVLSEFGAQQARALGEHLVREGVTPSLVVHGSLRRQRDTAEALVRAARWRVRMSVDSGWDEFDHEAVLAAYGALRAGAAGRSVQEVFEAATTAWTVDAGDDPDLYEESFAGFVDRVGFALRRWAGTVGSGETVVVVTSGGVIAAVCGLLTLIPQYSTDIATVWQRLNTVTVNASVTRVLVGSTGVRLLTFNEHSFLDRRLVTYR